MRRITCWGNTHLFHWHFCLILIFLLPTLYAFTMLSTVLAFRLLERRGEATGTFLFLKSKKGQLIIPPPIFIQP